MGKKSAEIAYVPIEKINDHDNNARIHTDSQVALIVKSIKQFGFTAPVLVDKNYTILAGHGRIKAARVMGMKEVPCVVIPLQGEKARAYMIADNRLGELSRWERSLLKLELSELSVNLDIVDLGFDASFLDSIGGKEKFESVSTEEMNGELKHECPKCGFRF